VICVHMSAVSAQHFNKIRAKKGSAFAVGSSDKMPLRFIILVVVHMNTGRHGIRNVDLAAVQSVVCPCDLHGFPPRRVNQSHVRLQSTANIPCYAFSLCCAFSAASLKWVVGIVSLNSGKCQAVDTASAFRLISHFTHLRRALAQMPLPI
jgi:hypothetical protein